MTPSDSQPGMLDSTQKLKEGEIFVKDEQHLITVEIPKRVASVLQEYYENRVWVAGAEHSEIPYVVITPILKGRLVSKTKLGSKLAKYQIIASYLAGYDGVVIDVPRSMVKDIEKHLESITNKFSNVSAKPKFLSPDRILLKFSDSEASSTRELLHITDIAKLLLELAIESVRNPDKSGDALQLADQYESDIDRACFSYKRLISRTVLRPNLAEETGVTSLLDLGLQSSKVNHLERMSDIALEIIQIIDGLDLSKLPAPIEKYCIDMLRLVAKSCDAVWTKETAFEIAEEKSSEKMSVAVLKLPNLDKGNDKIPNADAHDVAKVLDSISSKYEFTRLLTLIQKVEGARGSAINLCETVMNMARPPLANAPDLR